MNIYRVELRHNNGSVRTTTFKAESLAQAQSLVDDREERMWLEIENAERVIDLIQIW